MPASIKKENAFQDEVRSKHNYAQPSTSTSLELKQKYKRNKMHCQDKPTVMVERKLLRRVSKTLNAYYNIVGKNIAVIVQTATKPGLKIFGTKPLVGTVNKFREEIAKDLEDLQDEGNGFLSQQNNQGVFKLPPLIIDGSPIPVHKMTQAQLRGFIPFMMKYATGRGKPGWGKEQFRPLWWPDEMPWANVRLDSRRTEEKSRNDWTKALRQVIYNCYTYHGRLDLLHQSEEFYNNINDFNANFISYDDTLGRYGCQIYNLQEETNQIREIEEMDECNEEPGCANINQAHVNNPTTITVPSNQPCYIYNLPQITNPIYILPVQVGTFNLVNVFPTTQVNGFNNPASTETFANTSQVIQEIASEALVCQEEVHCEAVLSVSEEESASTVNEMVLINSNYETSFEESTNSENSNSIDQQNLSNQIENADFIFIDDKQGVQYNLDEISDQSVIILDPQGEEASYQIDEGKWFLNNDCEK